MKYLMLHDIRNISQDFFPKRYEFPYFYTHDQFTHLLNRFPPTSYDSELIDKYIYSFDDGLVDHLNVAKILFEKNIKAIFFIPSAPVLERIMILSHKIQFILASRNENEVLETLLKIINSNFELDENYLNKFRESKWVKNIWSDEMIFITRILREFKTSLERNFLIDNLFKRFVSSDEKDFAANFYLSFEQVQEISDMNHLIGGHGYKSNDLLFCDESEIRSEIINSDTFIRRYNKELKYYAYANGGFNDYAISLLENLNFKMAFTTHLKNKEKSKLKNLFKTRIDPSKVNF